MLSFQNSSNPNYSEDEKNILEHEYNLRQFIHIATRYVVNAIYESRTDESPFTFYYEHFIANARRFFEAFKNSLRKELSNYTPDKWAAYGIDIKERFLPMMELYKKWYKEHKTETEKFGEFNPYELMYENILSTEKEILKYFTEHKNIQEKNKGANEKYGPQSEPKQICSVPFVNEIFERHHKINDAVLDAYYHQMPQPTTQEEVSTSYRGELNHYYQPFQVSVLGAYPLMKDWEVIEWKIKNENAERGWFKGYTREAVFEALEDFAKGFQYGYDNFLKDKVVSSTSLSSTEAYKVQKIYSYVSSPFVSGAFSESYGEGKALFQNWYNDGVQAGYYYCAWYLILDNHTLFEPYFHRKGEKQEMQKEIEVEDAEDFIRILEEPEKLRAEQLKKGFVELETYILKNVHEDVRADVSRLKQLRRNILNWKAQLTTVFVEPENQIHDDLEYFNLMKVNAERMIGKIASALYILDERIEHKSTLTANKNNDNSQRQKDEGQNDFLLSSIEDYLADFKNEMSDVDYQRLVQSFKEYFEAGRFPQLQSEIKISGNVAVKKFGWALNQLYRSQKHGKLAIEYLRFGKENLSIFKKVAFDENNYLKSTLYRYYTDKQK